MRQVYVYDENQYALVVAPKPKILLPTDVIVKTTATTLCGSDVHILQGHMNTPWGFVLGHEFVGTIEEIGSAVSGVCVGDRVVAPAAPWCGSCARCRDGQTQACERGGIFGSGAAYGNLGGAHAEFVRVPWADSCVSKIPDNVTDTQAITVGDILSTGWTSVKHAVSAPGQTLVVFGAGPIGLAAIHSSTLHGCARVIANDVMADRLELAKELGADFIINASEENVSEAISKITAGKGANAIIDAAGTESTIASWPEVAALSAKVAMVAIPSKPIEMQLASLLQKNITVWSGFGDLKHMDMLLDLISIGKLDPSPIFTETVPFDAIENALDEFISRKPGLVKPLVVMGG